MDPCYRVPHADGTPRYWTSAAGEELLARYGGERVGDHFCFAAEAEPPPPEPPAEQWVDMVATGVKSVAAPVLELFKNVFAPPPVRGTRSPEAARAAVAEPPGPPEKQPCACHGQKPPPGTMLLGLLLVAWLAWKAFKR